MVKVRQHKKDKQIYYVNGKTVIVDERSFIASVKLNEKEEKVFRGILKFKNKNDAVND